MDKSDIGIWLAIYRALMMVAKAIKKWKLGGSTSEQNPYDPEPKIV